ncbi:hypothetical protein HYV74_00400 [Candidatus Uhrbacteria bacterium]|nr:hypothetical protein [Candidatus Uhrbacteria bacterium]
MLRPWMRGALVGMVLVMLPVSVHAATYDVAILPSDVILDPAVFFVGDAVRVYARVKNVGDRDVQGNVFFSENGTGIGTPPFSVRAHGAEEEVWVDWQPATVGDRQIFLRVVTAPETRDGDLSNNEMIVPVFVDRDTDGDRSGDRVDADDDNDGLPDDWETAHGLNPRDAADAKQDPDADGTVTVEEYRAGTDPFKAPPPPPVPAAAPRAPVPAPASSPAPSPVALPAREQRPAPVSPQRPAPPASQPVKRAGVSSGAPKAPLRAPSPAADVVPPSAVPAPDAASSAVSPSIPPSAIASPETRDAIEMVRAPIAAQLESLLGKPMRVRNIFPIAMGGVSLAALVSAIWVFRRARRS